MLAKTTVAELTTMNEVDLTVQNKLNFGKYLRDHAKIAQKEFLTKGKKDQPFFVKVIRIK